jgi:hypothetical protein
LLFWLCYPQGLYSTLGSTQRWSHALQTWLLGQQSRPHAIWLLRWQHSPVTLLPQNWLAVHTTDGPHAWLPAGTHMLLMQVLPAAQQPPLQNDSEGRQHTCADKHEQQQHAQEWASHNKAL